jgi:hypothetical protein
MPMTNSSPSPVPMAPSRPSTTTSAAAAIMTGTSKRTS